MLAIVGIQLVVNPCAQVGEESLSAASVVVDRAPCLMRAKPQLSGQDGLDRMVSRFPGP